MIVTWTPRAGVELEGSDDLARAHDWLEQADAGPDAPLALQLDALAEAATWCRVRPSDTWGELLDFVDFENTRVSGGSALGWSPLLDRTGRFPALPLSAAGAATRECVPDASPRGEGKLAVTLSTFAFQETGVEWLSRRRRAILCDEQGLGKTVQALLAWWRHRQHTALVVVTPLSVLPHWAAACRDWLGVDPVHEGAIGDLPLQAGAVSLTTWERLPGRPPEHDPAYALVVDEAHRAKSRSARRTKAIRAWSQVADTCWGLTGTPILSAATDLPGVAFALDLPVMRPMLGRTMTTGKAASVFARRIRECMLRRTRDQVEIELPSKVYDEHPVELAMAHAADIDQCSHDLEQALGRPVDADLIDMLFGLVGDTDDESIRWGDAMGVLASLRSVLAMAKAQQLVGGARSGGVVGSPALQALGGRYGPLVVASAHRAPVVALGAVEGWSSILGGIPATERQRRIDAFQAGELAGLAITIGAGGVGITLTRARCMVVVDRAWTASENDQVEDRICRIGQAADVVHIVDVVADHPIDKFVAKSIARKRSLIRRDVDAGAVPDWREAHRARIARWRRVLEV